LSLTFNQIVDTIDDNCKSNSSNYSLADKTRDINIALDRALALIFQVGGTWQFDDSNHSDYPIITTSLLSGIRDYSFVDDEQGNLILDIYKVMVKDPNGIFHEIQPIDVQTPNNNTQSFYDGQNITGIPSRYDKTANGIFLDAIPSYGSSQGLKIYINREASYFTVSDTTKKPGIAGLFHEYLALRPSYQYAYRNGLKNLNILKKEMEEMEDEIQNYYKSRERDTQKTLKARRRSSR
jgi:hypothetical protein